MSDTKWRKLFGVIVDAYPDLNRMVVKFVDVDEPRQIHFPPSFDCPRPYMDTVEYGPTELRAIEWVEFTADLSSALGSIGIFPLSISGDLTRVTGYTDPIP